MEDKILNRIDALLGVIPTEMIRVYETRILGGNSLAGLRAQYSRATTCLEEVKKSVRSHRRWSVIAVAVLSVVSLVWGLSPWIWMGMVLGGWLLLDAYLADCQVKTLLAQRNIAEVNLLIFEKNASGLDPTSLGPSVRPEDYTRESVVRLLTWFARRILLAEDELRLASVSQGVIFLAHSDLRAYRREFDNLLYYAGLFGMPIGRRRCFDRARELIEKERAAKLQAQGGGLPISGQWLEGENFEPRAGSYGEQ